MYQNESGTAFEMFHNDFYCFDVRSNYSDFKRVIKYQTFQTPFYSDFESVANNIFSFVTNFG